MYIGPNIWIFDLIECFIILLIEELLNFSSHWITDMQTYFLLISFKTANFYTCGEPTTNGGICACFNSVVIIPAFFNIFAISKHVDVRTLNQPICSNEKHTLARLLHQMYVCRKGVYLPKLGSLTSLVFWNLNKEESFVSGFLFWRRTTPYKCTYFFWDFQHYFHFKLNSFWYNSRMK